MRRAVEARAQRERWRGDGGGNALLAYLVRLARGRRRRKRKRFRRRRRRVVDLSKPNMLGGASQIVSRIRTKCTVNKINSPSSTHGLRSSDQR